MKKPSIKNIKTGSQIQKEISKIVNFEIKDPRISPFTSITEVTVTSDLEYANVYVSALDEEIDETLSGLESASGFIRKELAKRLNLRNTPKLKFIKDNSLSYGAFMSELIDKVVSKDMENSGVQAEEIINIDESQSDDNNEDNMEIEDNLLISAIKNSSKIAITGHIRPDGDCIGACLGLYNYIKDNYPDVDARVFLTDPVSKLSFLSGFDEIYNEAGKFRPDSCIIMDVSVKERLGDNVKLFERSAYALCIDHHITNDGFADDDIIVNTASSTCEVLTDLLDMESISKKTAECLYTGIIHDTGVFKYSSTSYNTMMTAANLKEKGIDCESIIDNSFYSRTKKQNLALAQSLLNSEVIEELKFIYSYLDYEFIKNNALKSEDFDGIVSQLKLTCGVEVALFAYEYEKDKIKFSLRSKDYVDVSKIASSYGGGGHIKAAGFEYSGSFESIIKELTDKVKDSI